MLDARLDDPSSFIQLIRLLKDIVVDCVVQCHIDGMTMQAMDASHVVVCTFKLSANTFSYYACEQPLRLGINLSSLANVLRCAKKGDTLLLKSSPDATTLDVLFQHTGNHRCASYELKLMHLDVDELDIPETLYHTTVNMPSQQLLETLHDLQIMGDVCTVLFCGNWIQFSTNGHLGKAKIILHPNNNDNTATAPLHIETRGQQEIMQAFSMKYFLLLAKANVLSDRVSVYADPATPLKLQYKLSNAGEVCFYLATRTEVS